MSLTKKDIDTGKYGKIIPPLDKLKNKSIPPGGYQILEFDGEYHRNAEGEYINLAPGFMKPEKHQDGKCVPCCFKNFNAPSQILLRNKCNNKEKKKEKR